MGRSRRVPPGLDKFFRPLQGYFHWDHFTYFRLLVLAMAVRWGRRNVANLYRYLDAEHHRTRCNNFFLIERWAPEAARRAQAPALVRGLRPGKGDILSLILDDSQKAKRGPCMEAVAKLKDPVTEAYIRGHHSVCAILGCRRQVMPWGIRLSRKPEHAKALGLPFRKTTELAAQLIRELQGPGGVTVVVLFEASSLCRTVVQACREQHLHLASTLQRHRSLFKPGWQLTAGRYGRNLVRRRRTATLVIAKPHGKARSRVVDAGWLDLSGLGRLPGVFSRKGSAREIRGLVTDDPALSAAQLIQTDDRRWTIEPWGKDLKQLLGLGHYQHRPYRAAVTHRHLVCCAFALLTHLRIARTGAQGHRRRDQAADLSTAAVQDQLRSLRWEDLLTSLQEERHEHPVIEERERLRVA